MERGVRLAILGQTASGNSTRVRLLSTLLLHDGGRAHVFGQDVFRQPREVQRLVNRVSVEASLFKKMSSTENLSYAARFYGMTSAETRERIPEILRRVCFPDKGRVRMVGLLLRGVVAEGFLVRVLLIVSGRLVSGHSS